MVNFQVTILQQNYSKQHITWYENKMLLLRNKDMPFNVQMTPVFK